MKCENKILDRGFTQHQIRKNGAGLPSTSLYRKSGAGFTLVEIIIVVSILALVGGGGITGLVAYGRSQAMSNTVSEVVNKLNLTKSKAFSQVKPSTAGCTNSVLSGYKFLLCNLTTCNTTPAPSYEINVVCGGVSTSTEVISTGKLPIGYSFDPGSQPSFFFPVISGGSTGGSITINDDQNDLHKTITVDPNGSISINTE